MSDERERGDDSADLVEFLAKAIVSQPEEVNVGIGMTASCSSSKPRTEIVVE
jgi:predicted RNA-binding protein YlqC (UPF0109 family)